MAWGILSWTLWGTLALLLLLAGIEDARKREIANWKNAAIALMAPLWWWLAGYGWGDVAWQVGIAVLAFAAFATAFHFGWMGGGDVKMITALALWLPGQSLLTMLMVMSIIGGVLTAIMLVDHRRRQAEGPVETPYGIAIAMAALLLPVLGEPIFNQFT
jgi:prepilin peptidase CpaA